MAEAGQDDPRGVRRAGQLDGEWRNALGLLKVPFSVLLNSFAAAFSERNLLNWTVRSAYVGNYGSDGEEKIKLKLWR